MIQWKSYVNKRHMNLLRSSPLPSGPIQQELEHWSWTVGMQYKYYYFTAQAHNRNQATFTGGKPPSRVGGVAVPLYDFAETGWISAATFSPCSAERLVHSRHVKILPLKALCRTMSTVKTPILKQNHPLHVSSPPHPPSLRPHHPSPPRTTMAISKKEERNQAAAHPQQRR